MVLMAPSGIKNLNETIISSVYDQHLSTMDSRVPLSWISSELSSIYSDHGYSIKPRGGGGDVGRNCLESCADCCVSPDSNNSQIADAMLTRLHGDLAAQVVNEASEDADFLTDLGELDFELGDLDPSSDVEMEDSFQEFIDSALGESSTFFVCKGFHGDSAQQHDDDDIFLKKEFLSSLGLRPVQKYANMDENAPLSSVLHNSQINNEYNVQDVLSVTPINDFSKDSSSFDAIPKKMCSCLEHDSVPKAVYSTAHDSQHESVRICPSSAFMYTSECSNCHTNKQVPEKFMSPLFIDTSLTGSPESLPPFLDDRLQVAIDKDQLSEFDKDTADIMKWLKENKKSYQTQDDNNNNTFVASQNKITEFTESTNLRNCVDLETFVDLEDFLNKVEDASFEHTSFENHCLRSRQQPGLTSKDVMCHSQMKLSFLEESPKRSWDDNTLTLESYSNFYSHTQDSLTPNSSHFSNCHSPAWSSSTDSAQSSPLGITNYSSTSDWEDELDESSMKSQLALLKLFSDENPEALLITDSPMPKSRYG